MKLLSYFVSLYGWNSSCCIVTWYCAVCVWHFQLVGWHL